MSNNTATLINQGMRCLVENLGDVRAEEFISVIMRERFDYTKWHRDLFGNMSAAEVNDAAADYAKNNPW